MRLIQPFELGARVRVVGGAGQPSLGGPDARVDRLHDRRVLHAIDDLLQPRASVDHVRARHRDATAPGVLQQARLVGHQVERFEGLDGQHAVTAQTLLIRANRMRRHIGDRHHDVDLFAGDEPPQESIEGLAIVIWRRVGDAAGAVPRRTGQTDRPIVAHDHSHRLASERTNDRQRGPLIAVGHENCHRHADSTLAAMWLS